MLRTPLRTPTVVTAVVTRLSAPSMQETRAAEWNPSGLSIPVLTVPEYCKAAPPYLSGELAGDVGFDPMCLAALANPMPATLPGLLLSAGSRRAKIEAMTPDDQQQALNWMRTAELKHARLAMLCAAGWPMAELANGEFLRSMGTNGRAPSLLNGALFDGPDPGFLTIVFGLSALLEVSGAYYGSNGGDYDFDPLGVASAEGSVLPTSLPNVGQADQLALSELKNGRLAMVAVAGFVAQEYIYGNPVVIQTPFFFGR